MTGEAEHLVRVHTCRLCNHPKLIYDTLHSKAQVRVVHWRQGPRGQLCAAPLTATQQPLLPHWCHMGGYGGRLEQHIQLLHADEPGSLADRVK